jgi:hypothetical protein
LELMNDFKRVRFLSQALATLAFIAIGVGVWFAVVAGGGTKPKAQAAATTTPALTHEAYALLYTDSVVHKTRISVLNKWPKPPYQTYHAGQQRCFEWWDKPVALYNLCFVKGLLSDKAIE